MFVEGCNSIEICLLKFGRCLQIFGKPALVPKIAARSGELCTVPQQCVLDENHASDNKNS